MMLEVGTLVTFGECLEGVQGSFWEANNFLIFLTWLVVVTWFHLLSDKSLSSTSLI